MVMQPGCEHTKPTEVISASVCVERNQSMARSG
jgi:hypothetical protein